MNVESPALETTRMEMKRMTRVKMRVRVRMRRMVKRG